MTSTSSPRVVIVEQGDLQLLRLETVAFVEIGTELFVDRLEYHRQVVKHTLAARRCVAIPLGMACRVQSAGQRARSRRCFGEPGDGG